MARVIRGNAPEPLKTICIRHTERSKVSLAEQVPPLPNPLPQGARERINRKCHPELGSGSLASAFSQRFRNEFGMTVRLKSLVFN